MKAQKSNTIVYTIELDHNEISNIKHALNYYRKYHPDLSFDKAGDLGKLEGELDRVIAS